MFNEELVDNITDSITNLDTRVGELERKETLTKGDGIGPFRYELHVDVNGDGDFTSVKDACDYVSGQPNVGIDEWLLWVHPGTYDEASFAVPDFTTLWGIGGDINIDSGTLASSFITIAGPGVTLRNISMALDVAPTAQDVFLIACTGSDFVLDNCRISLAVTTPGAFVAGLIKCTNVGSINFSDCQFEIGNSNTGLLYALYLDAADGQVGNYIRSCRIWRTSSSASRGIFFAGTGSELYVLETSILPESTDIYVDTGATVYLRATNYATGGGAGDIEYLYPTGPGTGTVTSVGLSAPSIFSVAGSPITSAGTLALTLATQVANRVFAGPVSGVDAAPTFRALVSDDIPALSASKITSGILPGPRGGTDNGSYVVGDILYANTTTSLARLAGVATGNALISGGVSTAPSWGKIDVTTHITGIVPPANGGTGVNNAGTLTVPSNASITGGGTLALAGFTLTAPATGTAVLGGGNGANTRLAIWTGANTISSDSGLTYASNLLTVAGRYILVGGLTSLTALMGGYPGDLASIEIGRNVPASTDVSYSVLALTHEQEGTDKVVGSIIWGNREISATNKRVAVIESYTGNTTASGNIRFYTLKSTETDVSESMRITENHAVWIGRAAGYSFTLAAEGQLETQSNARIGGTLAVLNTTLIAASAPSTYPLYITSDQPTLNGSAFGVEVYSGAAAGRFYFARAQGSLGTPTAVSSGQRLFTLDIQGYDGDSFEAAAQIHVESEGTIADEQVPGRMKLLTANASGVLTEAMRIDSSQFVGIGSANPLVKLHLSLEDAATNAVSETFRIDHNTTGTPAAGYGTRLLHRLESSTTQNQNAIALESAWTVATNATRTSEYRIYSVTNAGALAEVARFDGGGGATPAAGNTGLMLWDVDNNTLERVTVGAAGSGGVGFKVLRIPN